MAKLEEQVTNQRNRGKGKKCAIAECPFTVHSRGWCQKHYMRFWRHGDPQCSDLTMHGQNKTTEYKIWCGLIQRCENPNNPRFADYGGRGIKICERWRRSFMDFLRDMGQRPSTNHSLDRIDNNGGYELTNCRWATRQQQQRNRKTNRLLTLNGATKTVAEWAEFLGLSEHLIRSRLQIGWTATRTLSEPRHDECGHKPTVRA